MQLAKCLISQSYTEAGQFYNTDILIYFISILLIQLYNKLLKEQELCSQN